MIDYVILKNGKAYLVCKGSTEAEVQALVTKLSQMFPKAKWTFRAIATK